MRRGLLCVAVVIMMFATCDHMVSCECGRDDDAGRIERPNAQSRARR